MPHEKFSTIFTVVQQAHKIKRNFKKGGIDRNTNSGASNKQLWLYKQSCF